MSPISILGRAKSKNKNARENFDKFAPSYKRMYLRWIESAKLKETRKKRIEAVVKRAVEDRKSWNLK